VSDRTKVIDMPTGVGNDAVQLFMDGDSGTWRLFTAVGPLVGDDVDFTLVQLVAFRDALSAVISDVERDPDAFNAEVRSQWVDA
jgi:hypothetical protein